MNIVGLYLACEDIVPVLDVDSKAQALEEIAMHLGRRHHIDCANILSALIRREKSASTAVGYGLAIPRARIAGISQPILAMVRTKSPIKFGAPDHHPVSVLFVIIVPEHANEDHLQILGTVAAMFASESFRHQIDMADDADALHRLFREWTSNSE